MSLYAVERRKTCTFEKEVNMCIVDDSTVYFTHLLKLQLMRCKCTCKKSASEARVCVRKRNSNPHLRTWREVGNKFLRVTINKEHEK